MARSRVVVIGECMVELSFTGPATAQVGYAGDSFNTAVYLARLGRPTAYATALGKGDRFSRGILDLMAAEGLERELVVEAEGRLPGLYAIERDEKGERSFHYWRGEAPARDFFRLADLGALARAFEAAALVYVTGITLAVVGEAGRAALLPLLSRARAGGAKVAFDLNYRPRLWGGPASARAAADALTPQADIIFIGETEGADLYGEGAAQAASAWAAAGAEVVERFEDRALRVRSEGQDRQFPPEAAGAVVDTTGAGDAFNAAYLDARLAGRSPEEAVMAARALAAVVIAHPGAIVPRAAMPA